MTISPQAYVRGSVEAVEMYCKAFDAEIIFEAKNEDKMEYMHCELAINGERIMAVSEAPEDCDTSKKTKWQTMAINICLGNKEAVQKAFDVLSDGGTVIDGPAPCPWNDYCSNVIDKYGVFWWIAI